MDPVIWALVLMAAMAHASWHAFVKSGTDSLTTMGLVFAGIGFWAFLAVFLVPLPHGAWFWLALGLACHFVYKCWMLMAYRVGDFGHVYPLARGSAPLFSAIGAYVLLSELPETGMLIGMGLIIAGIMVLALRGGPRVFSKPLPLVFALLTGLATAAYSVVDAYGTRQVADPYSFLAWIMFLDGTSWALTVWVLRGRSFVTFLRGNWHKGLLAGGIAIFGFWVSIWAMATTHIGPVAALREVSVLFAVLLGMVIFKEGFGPWRLVASMLIVLGVAAMQVL